jgi:hypothetical protein
MRQAENQQEYISLRLEDNRRGWVKPTTHLPHNEKDSFIKEIYESDAEKANLLWCIDSSLNK